MASGKKAKIRKVTPPPTPKQPKPWDRPPLPAKGDDDERNTFEWVGRALSEWEHFEAYFGLIFGVLVGAKNETEPALRAYGSVMTFRGRGDMIRAAADAYFVKHPHPAQAMLKLLLDEATGFAALRNDIAHGIVQPYSPDGQTIQGSALIPARHATKTRKLAKQTSGAPSTITLAYAYGSAELMAITKEFHLLANRTMGLHRNMLIALQEKRRP
ncbi:MAG TPA: hypothetical protein VGN05_15785 [Parvibaculum sp.]|jgi:hypothetical protein